MPLVQFDLPRPLFEEKGTEIREEVHLAFIDALDIPPDDKFQIFRPRDNGELVFDPTYGGVDRQSLMVIQVLMVHRYPVALKRELYRALVTRLGKVGCARRTSRSPLPRTGMKTGMPAALPATGRPKQ